MADETLPRTRAEAKVAGLKFYFTGEPCKRGHVAPRFTSTRICVPCGRRASLAWRHSHLDEVRERDNELAQGRYAADPQKFCRRVKEYYAENRTEVRARKRELRLANLEQEREKDRQWHRDNPEKSREKARRNRKKNYQQVLARNRNRKARQRNAEGRHTAADIARIRAEQNDICKICRINLNGKGHVDHIIPLARGGSNWPSNLQLLCATCNVRKSAKMPTAIPQFVAEGF